MRFAVVAALLALAAGPTAHAQTVIAGGGPGYSERAVTVQGQKATLSRITLCYHQMDLPPDSGQPIGLCESFFILQSAKTSNARHCGTWVRQVQADEAAWTPQDKLYPYFQIAIAAKAKQVSLPALGGLGAWQDKDVLCWEAMDFGPPLY